MFEDDFDKEGFIRDRAILESTWKNIIDETEKYRLYGIIIQDVKPYLEEGATYASGLKIYVEVPEKVDIPGIKTCTGVELAKELKDRIADANTRLQFLKVFNENNYDPDEVERVLSNTRMQVLYQEIKQTQLDCLHIFVKEQNMTFTQDMHEMVKMLKPFRTKMVNEFVESSNFLDPDHVLEEARKSGFIVEDNE